MLTHALINHLIQQNKETQAKLSAYAGRSLSFTAAGITLNAILDSDGFLQPLPEDAHAEAIIAFQPSALTKILQQHTPSVGDIQLSGDTDLGMVLLPLLGGLKYYANDDLSRLFGDALAGSIMQRVGRLNTTLHATRHSIFEQLRDYAHEAEAPVLSNARFSTFFDEVAKLRNDTDRLAAHLAKLEQKLEQKKSM